MTQKELNGIIRSTDNPLWFRDIKVQFIFSHLDITVEKEGFTDIYQYVSRQVRLWDKINTTLPSEFNQSKIILNRLLNSLDQFITQGKNYSVSQLNNSWNSVRNQIGSLNNPNYFVTESPITTFLLEIFNNHGQNYYSGAFNYLVNHSGSTSLNNPQQLTGAFMAYEFKYQESTISKRRGQEKSANSRLRNDFEKYFTETGNSFNEHIATVNQMLEDNFERIDQLVEEKNTQYDEWFSKTQDGFHAFNATSLKTMEDNEKLYKEKLKLEAPANYWKERAIKLKQEGTNWLYWLLGSSIVGVLALGAVLYFISDGTLKDLFNSTGMAIRWSIVFITFVSFLAYAVRVFSKLTFSSFHLVRDAEEREQLAYVYLALKKEKNIDDTERHLVMQSIFSRADSGLLKDDTSPTMPGNIVDKFIAKN